jgi:lysophospholipase L1-like esterase
MNHFLAALILVVAGFVGTVCAGEPQANGEIRIVLLGDSTVCDYPHPPADKPDMTGWGQVLGEFFNDRVVVLNHAAGGRSSKSFLREGRWSRALLDKPDYVFIQFGHNDCPGKGDRTTDPAGDFRDYLRQYVEQTRAAGGKPVLITPVARRTFVNGKLIDILQPYADAMKFVGAQQHVPVIDLHAASSALYRCRGDAGTADLSASAGDRTHFSRKGALTMAGLVVAQLPAALPELAMQLQPEFQTSHDHPSCCQRLPADQASTGTSRRWRRRCDSVLNRSRHFRSR